MVMKIGCGKIMYGNKSDGEINCGDDKCEWSNKVKEFIRIGKFYCKECQNIIDGKGNSIPASSLLK